MRTHEPSRELSEARTVKDDMSKASDFSMGGGILHQATSEAKENPVQVMDGKLQSVNLLWYRRERRKVWAPTESTRAASAVAGAPMSPRGTRRPRQSPIQGRHAASKAKYEEVWSSARRRKSRAKSRTMCFPVLGRTGKHIGGRRCKRAAQFSTKKPISTASPGTERGNVDSLEENVQ